MENELQIGEDWGGPNRNEEGPHYNIEVSFDDEGESIDVCFEEQIKKMAGRIARKIISTIWGGEELKRSDVSYLDFITDLVSHRINYSINYDVDESNICETDYRDAAILMGSNIVESFLLSEWMRLTITNEQANQ